MARNPSSSVAAPVFVDADPFVGYPAVALIRDPSLASGRTRDLDALRAIVQRYQTKVQKLGVLADLDAQQRREMAALVLDEDCAYQSWLSGKSEIARIKNISKRGPGHIRLLVRKVERVRRELEEFIERVHKVDRSIADRVVPRIGTALQALDDVGAELVPTKETVAQYTKRQAGWHAQVISQHPQPRDPRARAADTLVRYLTDVVRIPVADAYVRAARIGNVFWNWSYKITRDDYGRHQCPSIRILLARRRSPRKGTSSKKRR